MTKTMGQPRNVQDPSQRVDRGDLLVQASLRLLSTCPLARAISDIRSPRLNPISSNSIVNHHRKCRRQLKHRRNIDLTRNRQSMSLLTPEP